MAVLNLQGVSKQFGATTAVEDIDLQVAEGQLACFLGPSGCGKTTLLRLVAGLEVPSSGRILVDGKDITHEPPHRRDVGMVFQSLALFPHLDVADNIAYGLRIRGNPPERCRRRASELLDLVQMPGVERRHVSQLSGGQRQRVAIARALALEPQLFLLDEPLSALDAKLREEMQVELRLLQQRVGVTTILVTHDQREAMTMADMVVVMNEGRIQQVGTPLGIYRRPANVFVADFIGSSNLLEGVAVDDHSVRVNGQLLMVADMPTGLSGGEAVTISIRPEEVALLPGEQPGANRFGGRIEFVRDVGQNVEFRIDCHGLKITSTVTPRDKLEAGHGAPVTVELPAKSCVVLP